MRTGPRASLFTHQFSTLPGSSLTVADASLLEKVGFVQFPPSGGVGVVVVVVEGIVVVVVSGGIASVVVVVVGGDAAQLTVSEFAASCKSLFRPFAQVTSKLEPGDIANVPLDVPVAPNAPMPKKRTLETPTLATTVMMVFFITAIIDRTRFTAFTQCRPLGEFYHWFNESSRFRHELPPTHRVSFISALTVTMHCSGSPSASFCGISFSEILRFSPVQPGYVPRPQGARWKCWLGGSYNPG